MQRLVVLDHCFTSSHRHSKETANILARDVGAPLAQIVEVEALTPGSPEELFTIENIRERADSKRIVLNGNCTVALVEHERRLSKLITRMTGKLLKQLDHLDAVCRLSPASGESEQPEHRQGYLESECRGSVRYGNAISPHKLNGFLLHGTALDGEGIQGWLEWEMEAMRWKVPIEISREGLEALVDSSEVPQQKGHQLLPEGARSEPETVGGPGTSSKPPETISNGKKRA